MLVLIKEIRSKIKWTPEKVQYAWTHGASELFPDIELYGLWWTAEDLCQDPFFHL